MKKGSKIIGTFFLILGIASIAMYFVIGDKFSNYKIVFDSNGGSTITEQILKKGEKVIKPADPTKENSEFVEWQLNGAAYNFDNIVESDLTLIAKWNDIINRNVKVTVGDEEYTTSVRDGETLAIESLNIPSKEGYMIKLYDENNEEIDLSTPITSDIVLTGEYVEIKTFTVKFDSNGGTKVSEAKVQEGEPVTEPTTTRDGYILDGWYLGEEKFDFTTPISKNITLKARWNDGPKVNVIFMSDEKVYKTISVKENTTVSKPANPTKKGYRFVEWQLDGQAFDFKTKITEEITLTAQFEEVTSFKVIFNSDGGSAVKTQEVTTKATKPTNPTKSGYKFVEWQLNGKTFDFNTTITQDIELKAIWEKEKPKYTVKFNNDDGSEITTQTVEEGSKVTKPTNPTKDGYRFVNWLYNNVAFNFDTPITKDITLTAHYEKVNTSTPSPEPTNEATNPTE